MNGYECTFHHIFMGGAYVLVRALCNGKTSAFQADDAGSIPAARSKSLAIHLCRPICLSIPRRAKRNTWPVQRQKTGKNRRTLVY